MPCPATRVRGLLPPHGYQHLAYDIEQEYHTGHDAVRDDERVIRNRELQPQPAVDDTEQHECPAVPDVYVTDQSALTVLEKVTVVDVAESRLDYQETDDHGSEDRVGLVEELAEDQTRQLHEFQ